MTDDRRRTVCLKLRLTPEEFQVLCDRMAAAGTTNREAFIRKMALDGMLVKLDVQEIREMISLLRYAGNNINQIAKRLNGTGMIYEKDIHDIKDNQNQLIDMTNTIVSKLVSVR